MEPRQVKGPRLRQALAAPAWCDSGIPGTNPVLDQTLAIAPEWTASAAFSESFQRIKKS
jgi:hypothetical protein